MSSPRRLLITGGAGFLGSNIAKASLERGDALTLLDDLSRPGARENLGWLRTGGAFEFHEADVRDASRVRDIVRESRPEAVLHLAGQVAMTSSITDPRHDFGVNALGSFNVLEAVRIERPEATVIYSSTNKVYGDLGAVAHEERRTRWVTPGYEHGFDESLPLSFHGPYGCSKGAADQYMLDYARIYGLRTVVFRHSSIFGDRQFSTFDQGWIGWFVKAALARADGRSSEPIRIAGDGKQVRDVLFVQDAVTCYLRALDIAAAAGEAFNIGGGMANSISLLELFALLENELEIRLQVENGPWRPADQRVFVADIRKAQRVLAWTPSTSSDDGIRRMIDWTRTNG